MTNEIVAQANDNIPAMAGMYSSIHAESMADRLEVFDAVNNADNLKDMVGKTITISDVIIQPVDTTDERTGEPVTRNRIVCVTPEGDAYGCMSTGIETAMKNLFAIVGMPTWEPAIKFDVVQRRGKKGYDFLTLELHHEA